MNSYNPMQVNPSEITQLFLQANAGEQKATDQLVTILYNELKAMASSRRVKFSDNHTMNTTALVNETWIKLKKSDLKYNNKNHFLSIAATAMRQILLDLVKSKNCLKRPKYVSIDTISNVNISTIEEEAEWFYQLDLILNKLERHSSRLATVFNLKFFCGLTLTEIAEFFEISVKTAQRDWEDSKRIISHTFELSEKD
jgi:RNA polymerase sigma factor (TIGR02999 family)